MAKIKLNFINGELVCKTSKHGKFSLVYRLGLRLAPSYYELYVPVAKTLSPDEQNILSGKLPYARLKKIKTLYYAGIENRGGENKLVARFDDKWFYSETPDIIECLKILREAEKKF